MARHDQRPERVAKLSQLRLERLELRQTRHAPSIRADHTRGLPAVAPSPGMDLHFLGGATTVTGSQYLLDTGRASVLIDCGMFQGSPNESVRNRVPFAFEPRELDARRS